MIFVREGQAGSTGAQISGVLQSSKTWEIRVDLEKRLVFPEVVPITLRPDIIVWVPPGQENCVHRTDCTSGREM